MVASIIFLANLLVLVLSLLSNLVPILVWFALILVLALTSLSVGSIGRWAGITYICAAGLQGSRGNWLPYLWLC